MNKDRVAGAAKQVAGRVKENTGKVLGDAELEAEGKRERIAGKIQNAMGGVKDALKE